MDDTIIEFARLWGQKEAMGMGMTSTLKEQEISEMCKGYDSLDLQTLLNTWSDEFNYTEWAEDEDEQCDTLIFFEKKIEELYIANYPSREDNINIEEVASAIEEILRDSEFDNIQDSTGYFCIKEDKERDLSRSVDVSRSTGEGAQPPHYVIYVCYEDEQSDWLYTQGLSHEELVRTLTEIAEAEWECASDELNAIGYEAVNIQWDTHEVDMADLINLPPSEAVIPKDVSDITAWLTDKYGFPCDGYQLVMGKTNV